MWILLVAAGAAAPCSTSRPSADLDAALDAFATAHTAQSLDAMEATARLARLAYPCLADVVSPTQAAKYHLLEAWMALGDRTRARMARDDLGAERAQAHLDAATAAAWRTGVSVDPAWLPTAPAQPIRQSYASAAARIAAAGGSRACASLVGLVADGKQASAELSDAASVLLQRVDGDGRVVAAAFAWPGDDVSSVCPAEVQSVTQEPPAPSLEWRISAGAGAILGAAPENETRLDGVVVSPGAFGGVGPALALGLSIPMSRTLRTRLELGYTGALAPLATESELQAAHIGSVALALELEVDRIRIAAGPALAAGVASVGIPHGSADGTTLLVGGAVLPSVTLIRSAIDLDLSATAGLYTEGERAWGIGSVSLGIGI